MGGFKRVDIPSHLERGILLGLIWSRPIRVRFLIFGPWDRKFQHNQNTSHILLHLFDNLFHRFHITYLSSLTLVFVMAKHPLLCVDKFPLFYFIYFQNLRNSHLVDQRLYSHQEVGSFPNIFYQKAISKICLCVSLCFHNIVKRVMLGLLVDLYGMSGW